jgi:hypothetical protein
MRMFKRLKMDVHAEATTESDLQDDDLSLCHTVYNTANQLF